MNPEELVETLYLALLGRPPEPAGLALWSGVIHSTGNPSPVFEGILESEEYKKRRKAEPAAQARLAADVAPVAFPPLTLSNPERIEMTTSCKDADSIPKCALAGEVFTGPDNAPCQRMHNGVIVTAGGYHGDWMSEIIQQLGGHHEPQEELLFHAAAPFMAPGEDQPVMVELGAFWSYYSLWFRCVYPNARNIMVEPDPANRRVGEKNFALNGMAGEFIEAAVGTHNGCVPFHCESDSMERTVKTVSVDGLANELSLQRIHLLHADVQGAEQTMLMGAEEIIRQGRLDWLFLSTHHHSISGDPLTHQRCLAWLKDHGATIIAEHSVAESFSGDGLIVARFGGPAPMEFPALSRNAPSRSFFRESEYDLAEADQQIRRLQKELDSKRSYSSRRSMPMVEGGPASLTEFERKWRTPENLDAVQRLVAQQAGGELFPTLADCAEPGYYFLHIPKTAGTSTNRFLELLSPRLEAWLWDQLIERERAGAPTFGALMSGHFHMHLEPFAGRKLKRFTILREPVARTVSHYLHVKRAPDHPYFQMAQSLSLLEFCTHPKTRHMVENYQARYLVDFGIDVRVPGALCSAEELASFQLQDLLDRLTVEAVPDDLLHSAAAANLESFGAVGVTEKFPQAMQKFAAIFDRADAPKFFNERHNAAPGPVSLDAETRSAILRVTEVDLALYHKVDSVC
jgi:FkbM family methyltransferase